MKPNNELRICQVLNPDVYLPCEEVINGLRCEHLEDHNDGHSVGSHSIRHKVAGDSYTCDEIDAMGQKPVKAQLPKTLDTKKYIIVLVVGVILAVLAAFTYQKLLKDGDGNLRFVGSEGAIRGANSQMLGYRGQAISGTNPVQKALGSKGKATAPAYFSFTNGKSNSGRKTLDMYLDLSTPKSRDLILLNADTLEALVENGRIELRLHLIPNSSPYAIYIPEVLAEAFHFNPELAWNVLMGSLKDQSLNSRSELTPKQVAKHLGKVASVAGVGSIDAAGIQNGTFTSWIFTVADDSRLTVGTKLPSGFIDGVNLDLTSMDLSKSNKFEKLITE